MSETDHIGYYINGENIFSQRNPDIVPSEGESVMFSGTGNPVNQDVPNEEFIVEKIFHRVRVPDEPGDLTGTITDVYLDDMNDKTGSNRKHTTGTIDGHAFSLRVDGDAPAGLVADIESALATLKTNCDGFGEIDPTRDYVGCPDCGQVLMGNDDGAYECITEEHGPFRIYYERENDE